MKYEKVPRNIWDEHFFIEKAGIFNQETIFHTLELPHNAPIFYTPWQSYLIMRLHSVHILRPRLSLWSHQWPCRNNAYISGTFIFIISFNFEKREFNIYHNLAIIINPVVYLLSMFMVWFSHSNKQILSKFKFLTN